MCLDNESGIEMQPFLCCEIYGVIKDDEETTIAETTWELFIFADDALAFAIRYHRDRSVLAGRSFFAFFEKIFRQKGFLFRKPFRF